MTNFSVIFYSTIVFCAMLVELSSNLALQFVAGTVSIVLLLGKDIFEKMGRE